MYDLSCQRFTADRQNNSDKRKKKGKKRRERDNVQIKYSELGQRGDRKKKRKKEKKKKKGCCFSKDKVH